MAPIPHLFGGKSTGKKAVTRRLRLGNLGPRYRRMWFDKQRHEEFEVIAIAQGGKSITAVGKLSHTLA